jgi:hypothetical protein
MAIQVLLAEDEVMVRQGVRVLLEQAGFQRISPRPSKKSSKGVRI